MSCSFLFVWGLNVSFALCFALMASFIASILFFMSFPMENRRSPDASGDTAGGRGSDCAYFEIDGWKLLVVLLILLLLLVVVVLVLTDVQAEVEAEEILFEELVLR